MEYQEDKNVVLERLEQEIRPPSMFKVILINDDYTPMDYVVEIIQEYFNKNRETAIGVMLEGHHSGKVICGVFSKDIAATKVKLVLQHSKKDGHPLHCIMEEV